MADASGPETNEPVRHFLAMLIATALVQDDDAQVESRRQAAALRDEVRAVRPDETMKLDGLWWRALQDAETPDLMRRDLKVSATLPAVCPLALADILSSEMPLEALEERVRLSASTG